MDIAEADRLLEEARGARENAKRLEREHKIEALQAAVDLAKKKKAAVVAQIARLDAGREGREAKIKETDELKEFLGDVYPQVRKRFEEDVLNADLERQAATRALMDLDSEISCTVSDLVRLRRGPASDKPPKAAVEAKSSSSAEPMPPDEALLPLCRGEVGQAYEECTLGLDSAARELGNDVELLGQYCAVAAGNVRLLLGTPIPLNSAEKTMLGRGLDAVAYVATESKCGCVEALNRGIAKDWKKYVAEADTRLAELESIRWSMRAKPKTYEEKAPPEPDPLLDFSLLEKATGLRVAVLGGMKNPDIVKWMSVRLGFGKVAWYGCYRKTRERDGMVQSIGAGGVDLIVLYTKFVGHRHVDLILKMARQRGIPLAWCNSTSKAEIASAVAKALGLVPANGGGK